MYDFDEKSMDSLETKSFNTVFSQTESSYDLGSIVSPRLLKSIYQSEDWVYILVDKIASKLAQIPWQVQKQSMKDGEEVLEPAFGHPVQRMLDEPNPLQSAFSFKYSLITDHTVTGNGLIFHASSKNWLVQVPAEIIEPYISGNGDLVGYRISGIDPNAFPVGSQMVLSARDVIHVKRPNSSSVFWGLSPLIPGANPSLFNRYSNEYLLNFYKKGAQPGIILEMMEETNEVQAKKLLQSLETAYTGRANQRRGMVLPKGVKASNIAHTIADQQITELIRTNRETLINIFGVPKHELSIADSGSLGSEEYKTALKNFWQGPLMAIGGMFESALTQRLKPQLGPGYVIKLNYSSVPILQEDVKERADTATAMLSVMTYNEVRQKIWKLPPIPGGDVLKDLARPANPFGSFAAPPTQQLAIEQKSSEPSPQELNRKAFHEYAGSDDGKWVNESRERIEEESKKATAKLQELWLKLLEDQVVASVSVLKEHLGEKAAVPGKRSLRRKIDEAMDGVKSEWEDGYTDALYGQVELGYDTVLDIPFNEPYREGVEAIRARDAKGRRELLKARSIDSFDQISKTTTERIMKEIERSMGENLSILEIAENISKIGANAAGRALTIARTETLMANSLGQAAAMKDAATVIPDLVKVWRNAGDDRVRGKDGGLYPDSSSDHWELGFQVVPSDEDFQDPRSGEKLAYPRDPKGSPGTVINCRCTMLTVSREDLPKLGLQ